jgi:hypothetical protein
MRRLRAKLTYANVISTLCLFLLLGGGAAVAASGLGKNTVGSKQVKKNAITTAKIKNAAVSSAKLKDAAVTTAKLGDGSVTTAKLGDGSVNGAKVIDNSLTGADINQATLNAVRAANVLPFSVNAQCGPASPFPAGVSAERTSEGVCKFTFPSPVASCAVNGTVHLRLQPNEITIAQDRSVQVSNVVTTPDILVVVTYAGSSKKDLPFDLTVVC